MKLPKLIKTYIVQVTYKSGAILKFEAEEFEIKKDLSEVSWNAYDACNVPMAICLDNIESVWVVGSKRRLVFK